MCTATRSGYVKLDITGQNWKQEESCTYLKTVAKKTLLIRVEANGKLQTLEIGIIKLQLLEEMLLYFMACCW
jgi:hypothetical protein